MAIADTVVNILLIPNTFDLFLMFCNCAEYQIKWRTYIYIVIIMYIGDIWHNILIIYEKIVINHNLKKKRLSETKVKSCAIHVFTYLVWNSQRLKKSPTCIYYNNFGSLQKLGL